MNEAEILNNDYFRVIAKIIKINLKNEDLTLEELQNQMPNLFEEACKQYNESLNKLFNDINYYNAVKNACAEGFLKKVKEV